MNRCADCGKRIKNIYTWDGRELGIECWKRIALPAIIAERAKKDEERVTLRRAQSELIAHILRGKNLSRIKSAFKLDFIPSVVAQVDAGRMLSNRQMELARDLFNTADYVRECLFQVATGELPLELVYETDTQRGFSGKLVKSVIAEHGPLPAQRDWFGYPIRTITATAGELPQKATLDCGHVLTFWATAYEVGAQHSCGQCGDIARAA